MKAGRLVKQVELPPLRRGLGGSVQQAAPSQRRMVEMERRYPDTSLFTVAACLQLGGDFDPGLLEPAFRGIANRHDALRTSFAETTGGAVLHRLHEAVEIDYRRLALASIGAAEVAAELRGLGLGMMVQPFDLRKPALIRVLEAVARDGTRYLLVQAHHSVSDVWSMLLLRRELKAICDAVGGAPPLPDVQYQFSDYAAWQNGWLNDAAGAEAVAFWRDHLGDAALHTELFGRRASEGRSPADLTRVEMPLPNATARALRRLAMEQEASPFTVFLALFGVLLRSHGAPMTPAVATPFLNRRHPGTQDIFGFLANVLTVRIEAAPDLALGLHLRRFRSTIREAQRYQHLPPAVLIDLLRPESSGAGRLLANLQFNFIPWLNEDLSPGGLQSRVVTNVLPQALAGWYDLCLFVLDGGDDFQLVLRHYRDVLPEDEAEALLRRYAAILEKAAADPEIAIGRLVDWAARLPD